MRRHHAHPVGLPAVLVAALAACRPATDNSPPDGLTSGLDAALLDAPVDDLRATDAVPFDAADARATDAADTPAHVPVSFIRLIQPSAAVVAASSDPLTGLADAEFSRPGGVVEAPGARASGPCVVWPFPLGYQRRITDAQIIDPHGQRSFLSADMLDLYGGFFSPLPFWFLGDPISVSLLGYAPSELTIGPVVFPEAPSLVSPVADAHNQVRVRPSDGIAVVWSPRPDGKIAVQWSAAPMVDMDFSGRCVFDATVGHGFVPPDALREVANAMYFHLEIGGFDRVAVPASGPTGPIELTVENDVLYADVVLAP